MVFMVLSLFKIQLETFSVEIPKDIKLSSDKIIECEVVRDQYGFIRTRFFFISIAAKPGTIFRTAIEIMSFPFNFQTMSKWKRICLAKKLIRVLYQSGICVICLCDN